MRKLQMFKSIIKMTTIIAAMFFMTNAQAGYISCLDSTEVMDCLYDVASQSLKSTSDDPDTTTVIDRGGSPSLKTTTDTTSTSTDPDTTTVIDRGGIQ